MKTRSSTDHEQAGSYRFVRRIGTVNALVLTGPANFRVIGQVARSAETRDQANGERKLRPSWLPYGTR
jgi:hypothetical protein